MKCDFRWMNVAAGIFLACVAMGAHAETAATSGMWPSVTAAYTGDARPYLLALNEGDTAAPEKSTPSALAAQPAEFEPPLWSGSNAHKYMGLATVALVGLTAITAPEEEEGATTPSTTSRTQGTHQSLGRLTAAMAAATVTSGLLTHWDDFHLEDGLTDPDNLHVMLGTLGALAMLNAVSKAPGNGHPGTGIAGGAMMAVAIKLTW